MANQLIVLAGPDPGTTYPLEEAFSIGSAPECNLIVRDDASIGPVQAELVEYRGHHVLTNLDRSNRVLLNDRNVVRNPLSPGDVVTISSLVFLYEEAKSPSEKVDKNSTGSSSTHSSLETIPDDPLSSKILDRQAAFEDFGSVVQMLGPTKDNEGRFSLLLEVISSIGTFYEMVPMLDRLLEVLCREFQADQGSIWLLEGKRWRARSARMKGQGKLSGEVRISRTLLKEVLKTRSGVLTVDAMDDDRFLSGQSIIDQKIRSALYVPMVNQGVILGLIQLNLYSPLRGYNRRDLELLSAIAMQTALAVSNMRMHEAARETERIEHELELAANIQADLLPARVPSMGGLSVAGRTIPAREVGGDYYDFLLSPDGNICDIVIGDVTGKGVPAGIVMVMARSFLLPLLRAESRTDQILVRLNEYLYANTKPSIFMSLLLMRWDCQRQELRYCAAGHEHLLLFRASKGTGKAILSGGVVLGVSGRGAGHFEEKCLEMEPGDTLLLYTDGVTEACNEKGKEFGLRRLLRLFVRLARRRPKEIEEGLVEAVRRFRGKMDPVDDLTIVVLRREA
ncbi:MAG: SpoIIE family protein phosphatase [Planctomycetota bacterium]|nr:SpoIIE family protein phosphatase [Planctomycetota bacterium]